MNICLCFGSTNIQSAKQVLNSKQSTKGYERIIRDISRRLGYVLYHILIYLPAMIPIHTGTYGTFPNQELVPAMFQYFLWVWCSLIQVGTERYPASIATSQHYKCIHISSMYVDIRYLLSYSIIPSW